MKKILIFTFIIVALSASVIQASDIGLNSTQHNIVVSTSDSGLLVEESISVTNSGYENVTSIKFWIQQDVTDVEIYEVESGKQLTPIVTERIRE